MNYGKDRLVKLYYSISEVCEMTGLEKHILRYWENEFAQLKPKKNRAGNRVYREKDIELVKTIQRLLYVEKYTLDGARSKLKGEEPPACGIAHPMPIKRRLLDELIEIRKLLD